MSMRVCERKNLRKPEAIRFFNLATVLSGCSPHHMKPVIIDSLRTDSQPRRKEYSQNEKKGELYEINKS